MENLIEAAANSEKKNGSSGDPPHNGNESFLHSAPPAASPQDEKDREISESRLEVVIDNGNGNDRKQNNSALQSNGAEQQQEEAVIAPSLEIRLVLELALAAVRFGSIGFRVESLVRRLLVRYQYQGHVIITNTDLMLSVFQDSSTSRRRRRNHHSALPFTVVIPLPSGTDFGRLDELSDLCSSLIMESALDDDDDDDDHETSSLLDTPTSTTPKVMTVAEVEHRLKEIKQGPPTWSLPIRGAAYVVTSVGFVVVLRGSWFDVALTAAASFLAFVTTCLFDYPLPPRLEQCCFLDLFGNQFGRSTYCMFLVAFWPSCIATVTNRYSFKTISLSVVTVSTIISEVPGFMITKAIAELIHRNVLAALTHLVESVLICLWLALGGICGYYLMVALVGEPPSTNDKDVYVAIDQLWYILFAPLLGICFSIYFMVGRAQLPASTLISCIGFGMSLTIEYFANQNLGTLVAAFVTSLVSCIWARGWLDGICAGLVWLVRNKCNCGTKHPSREQEDDEDEIDCDEAKEETRTIASFFNHPKPVAIVLLPAFFILVGGSLGVRGFAALLNGDPEEGREILVQFLVVPALLVMGIYLG